jgi:hypothetical protein
MVASYGHWLNCEARRGIAFAFGAQSRSEQFGLITVHIDASTGVTSVVNRGQNARHDAGLNYAFH